MKVRAFDGRVAKTVVRSVRLRLGVSSSRTVARVEVVRAVKSVAPMRSRSSAPHRWQPARSGFHWAEWGAEFLGTAILVFGGLSAVALDFGAGSPVAAHIPSVSARLLLTGLLFAGTGSLVVISPFGRRSGGHINPAVTLAFWGTGHVHPHDLAGYVASQCLGAISGAFLLRAAWGATATSVRFGVTQPGRGLSALQAAGVEALMTAALVTLIMVFVSSTRTARWTPLAVWGLVAVFVWRVAPYTGTSLNPARSLGPAVVARDFGFYWVYVAGPLAGAAAVVLAMRLSPRTVVPLTAKLFHHPGDSSTFRTSTVLTGGADTDAPAPDTRVDRKTGRR